MYIWEKYLYGLCGIILVLLLPVWHWFNRKWRPSTDLEGPVEEKPTMLSSQYPTAIIHCPDCGVECNFVANSFAEMPFSYPGTYHPHQEGSQGCLKRQVRNLKKRIEQLTEENTGKKYLVRLVFAGRQAVVIDNTPEDAIQRARLYEPNGGWEHASMEIITRVRASRTARVLAMERHSEENLRRLCS